MTQSEIIALKTAHLALIQGVISRVSGFSAAVKNFAITVTLATVAIAFDKEAAAIFWVALGGPVFFLLLDSFYHQLELRYRDLYNHIAQLPADQPTDMLLEPPVFSARHALKTLFSLTVLPFYVLLGIGLYLALGAARAAKECDSDPAAPLPMTIRC